MRHGTTKRRAAMLIVIAAVIVAAWSATVFAATQPRLGIALNFTVLAGSTITNTGPTVITGNLGLDPGTASRSPDSHPAASPVSNTPLTPWRCRRRTTW